MAKFFGVRLSENIIKRPDGFLICMGATIARTGYQKYKGSELDTEELSMLGIKDIKDEDDVQVLRLYEDVFRPATLASFEGVVFTLTHPGKLVTVDTINENNQGHIQNVRMGAMLPDGNWPILCDIFVTGQEAIDAILIDGVRELSCGYNYKLKLFNGNICQYDIIGNHVALVESGRAGKYASIKDSAPPEGFVFMAEKMTSKFLRAVGLHALATKTTPEQFAVALDATEEAEDNSNETEGSDMAHKAGCKGGDSCTCDSKGKDAQVGKDGLTFDERMHQALDRQLAKMRTNSAMDDDKTLAELMQGGNGGLKTKNTPALDGKEEEGEDEAGEGEEGKDESEGEEGNDSEHEGEDEEAEGEDEEIEGEDEAVQSNASPAIPAEARFKTEVPSATDSAAAFRAGANAAIKAMKASVAQSKDARVKGAFDTLVKTVKGKSYGRDGYKAFAAAAGNRSKTALDSMPKNAAQLQKEMYEAIDAEYASHIRKG